MKKVIIKKLNKIAKICLKKYGIRKTTIDQIVDMVGISKGSFYNFYLGKEIFFFEVLEEYQNSLIEQFANTLKKENNINAERFSKLLYELYQTVGNSFIMNIIKGREFEYLIRRLPNKLVAKHHSLDDGLARQIFSHVNIKNSIDISILWI